MKPLQNPIPTRDDRKIHVSIRPMKPFDMKEIEKLELDCYGQLAMTRHEILKFLRPDNCIVQIAEDDKEILGYIIYRRLHSEIRIINIAVKPRFRRLGVGYSLIERLQKRYMEHDDIWQLTTSVNERNLVAQIFFRGCGFWCIDSVGAMYGDEDGYVMTYEFVR